MKAAAIYCRVSTEEQVANTSLRGQLDSCREHAARLGYTVTKEVQEDFTGTRLDRPGLSEIRLMAEGGELDAVVVYEVDRLSRRLAHTLLLQEEFERRGVELLFVNSQDDTTSPEGRMFFSMRGAFGEYEKAKISERLRLGKMRLAKQGKVIGNRLQPLGYVFVDGQYEIVEEEARTVRQIFEWSARDRLPIRQIGLRLTQRGARTKRGNTHWAPSSVKTILDNPVYTGTAYWNRHESIEPRTTPAGDKPRKYLKTSKRIRERTDWIGIPCPAIVSQELWDAAQKQLQVNKARSPRNSKRAYLLRGLIKCGRCGYRYYGRGAGGNHYYYCGGEVMADPIRASYTGQKCPAPYLRADRLEARVWKYVEAQVTDEDALLATFEMRGAGHDADLRRDQDELETSHAAEAKLTAEREKMLDAYAQDVIALDVLRQRLAAIQKKQDALTDARAELLERMERRKTATATAEAVKEYCAQVREGMARAAANGNGNGNAGGVDYRRAFLEMLETEIVVDLDSGELHIRGIINGTLPLFEEPGGDGGGGGSSLLRSTDAHSAYAIGTSPGAIHIPFVASLPLAEIAG
jgi:site-specific DNA recombinase